VSEWMTDETVAAFADMPQPPAYDEDNAAHLLFTTVKQLATEVREHRAQELTSEEREALASVRFLVQQRYDDACDKFAPNKPDGSTLTALAVLDRLIGGGR
jgi:hypothetical protein